MASELMVGFSPKTRNQKKINIFLCAGAHMCAHMCAPVAKKKKIFFTKCARGAHMCAHVHTENIFFQKKKNTQKMSKKPVFSTPFISGICHQKTG